MGRFLFTLVVWGIFVIAGWLAGDRYGAPDWASNLAERVFVPVESQLGIALKNDDSAQEIKTLEDTNIPTGRSTEPDASEDSTSEPSVAVASDGGVDNAQLRMNDAGFAIIKESEGLRLESYSAGGKSYIGYGHQRQPGDPARITEAQAEAFLREDVRSTENGVRGLLVRAANENEFSAMVSLAYNLGVGRFKTHSEVLTKFNAGDKRGAADAFRNHNRGGGKVLQHLVDRREKERALFLKPVS